MTFLPAVTPKRAGEEQIACNLCDLCTALQGSILIYIYSAKNTVLVHYSPEWLEYYVHDLNVNVIRVK